MNMKEPQHPPAEYGQARVFPETVLTVSQIEQMKSAVKDIPFGKLTITIKYGEPVGFIVEKSERFY
jgi:hypothetical protein